MPTIDDIRFSDHTYGSARHAVLLLYHIEGVHVPMNLPNASVMSFTRVFTDTAQCQNHVRANLYELITLFAYGHNMQQWLSLLAPNTDLPAALQEIKCFCHSDDHGFFRSWLRRHRHRFQNTFFNILDFEDLNQKLLIFGVDHLTKLKFDFHRDSPQWRQLDLDYRETSRALANYFWERANR